MTVLAYLVPAALLLGLVWLVTFIWSLNSGQYEDLDKEAWRILAEDEKPPAPPTVPPEAPAGDERD